MPQRPHRNARALPPAKSPVDKAVDKAMQSGPPKLLRSAGTLLDGANDSGRLVSYVLSDTSVGRDNHVIAADAWDLKNFLRNPVMPWAHDTSAPPIARWIDISSRGQQLVGTAEYADAETYPFADTIFRLVKGGFLNAVSTSWIPKEWKFSGDRSRPGGVDFFRVELLEVSQVPVPALPTALVTARDAGIDTGPLYQWAERMLDSSPELAVLPRAELERLRRDAAPVSVSRHSPRTHGAQMIELSDAPPDPAAVADPAPIALTLTKRSLWHVGWLAMMLDDLGALQTSTEYEAAIEEDGSLVPAQLLAALKSLGDVLIAMTQEEVAEMLGGTDEEDLEEPRGVFAMSTAADLKREAFHALRRLDAGALNAILSAMRLHLNGEKVSFSTARAPEPVPLFRAGKVLSAENERCLREAHGHMTKAVDLVRDVVEKNGGDEGDGEDDSGDGGDDEIENRAARKRRAQARARKLKITQAA